MGRRPGREPGNAAHDAARAAAGFGDALKAHREAKELSQQALADLTGMNLGGITKLEQGRRVPSWETVLLLADALGVTPNDFLPPKSAGADKGRRKAKG